MEAIIIFKDNSVVDCNKIAIELFNKQMKYELITQLSHIVNHKFLYKKASLSSINRHFLI